MKYLAALIFVSVISFTGTLLPYLKNKVWWVRGQAYLRQWYFFINLFCLFFWIILLPHSYFIVLPIIVFCIASSLCFVDIFPFSLMYPPEIIGTDKNEQTLSILIYNVKEDNDRYQDLIELQDAIKPTLLLLLETNEKWNNALLQIEPQYKNTIKAIREDTYGLILMSRLEFRSSQINYLSDDQIPSVEVVFNFLNRPIQFLGLHPKPPIPGEALTSKQKDREFEAASKLLSKTRDQYLQIVAGDLNDVVWSRTSKKFKKKTGLKDPRVGRGTYSTFPTYFPIRFPLDQIFCSPSFKLSEIKRLPNIGSDHYPIFVEFSI